MPRHQQQKAQNSYCPVALATCSCENLAFFFSSACMACTLVCTSSSFAVPYPLYHGCRVLLLELRVSTRHDSMHSPTRAAATDIASACCKSGGHSFFVLSMDFIVKTLVGRCLGKSFKFRNVPIVKCHFPRLRCSNPEN